MKRLSVMVCALVVGFSMSSAPHAMARGGGGHSSVSFSHSSGRSLLGTSTRSGSGLGKLFSSSTPKSNSVLGSMSANRSSGNALRNAAIATTAVGAASVASHNTASASTDTGSSGSSNTSRASDTHYQPGGYAPIASAPTRSYNPPPQQVIVHHDSSGDNGFVNGMIMGSIMSHHDDSRPVIVNNTPSPAQYAPVSAPAPVQTVASNPAPQTVVPAPAPVQAQPASSSSHTGLFLFILLVLFVVIAVVLYRMRQKRTVRSLGEHMVDQVIQKVKHHDDPTQQDMTPFVNPMDIKIPVDGSAGKASVISLDLDVRVQSMDAAGHFPQIKDKTFTATAYTKLVCGGVFEGASIERIYLDDASMFVQLVMDARGKVIETVLYTNVESDQLSEADWETLIADNTGRMGLQTFPVPDANGGKNVIYDRMIDPEVKWVPPVEAEEDIMTSAGPDMNKHKFMIFEREHGDMSEFLLVDARYNEGDDGQPEDSAFIMSVGIPVNVNAIHAY